MFKKIAIAFAVVALFVGGAVAPSSAASVYYYAGTGQSSFGATEPTAVYANVKVYNPTLDCTGPDWESHTLIEMAMIQGSGGSRQIAEIGARKACNAGTPDTDMRVMVYVWRNGVACGYSLVNLCGTTHDFEPCDTVGGVNNCGQSTDNWDVGQAIPSGTTMRMGIQYFNNAWWFAAHQSGGTSEYLGRIVDDLWTDAGVTFTSADEVSFFGEAGPGGGSLGCTDMGTGVLPAAPSTGAVIGSVTYLPAGIVVDVDATSTYITDSSKYNALVLGSNPANNRTMLIGGPGNC